MEREPTAAVAGYAMLSGVTESQPTPASMVTSTTSVIDFDAFYRQHAAELHRALTLAIGSADLAREAVDEAMTRAYARWRTVSGYERPAGWVYRVAMNWSRSRFRARRRETLDPFAPGSAADVAGREHAVADPALASAMSQLSVEHRSVVVLRYLLDWSEAETAVALGVAPGTVKSRLSRALERLAAELSTGTGMPATGTPDTDRARPEGDDR